jgi:hypothetical protein
LPKSSASQGGPCQDWAAKGYGPQPVRDGNRLLYDPAEITAFISSHKAAEGAQ